MVIGRGRRIRMRLVCLIGGSEKWRWWRGVRGDDAAGEATYIPKFLSGNWSSSWGLGLRIKSLCPVVVRRAHIQWPEGDSSPHGMHFEFCHGNNENGWSPPLPLALMTRRAWEAKACRGRCQHELCPKRWGKMSQRVQWKFEKWRKCLKWFGQQKTLNCKCAREVPPSRYPTSHYMKYLLSLTVDNIDSQTEKVSLLGDCPDLFLRPLHPRHRNSHCLFIDGSRLHLLSIQRQC